MINEEILKYYKSSTNHDILYVSVVKFDSLLMSVCIDYCKAQWT